MKKWISQKAPKGSIIGRVYNCSGHSCGCLPGCCCGGGAGPWIIIIGVAGSESIDETATKVESHRHLPVTVTARKCL
jgi:hypothetical protein